VAEAQIEAAIAAVVLAVATMILALVTLATAFLEPQSSGDNLFLSHQGSLWSCPW
jgi:hypothetical protein